MEANVTEGITGLMMKDSDEIRFYDSPAQIEFVSSLPSNYKPGLKYTALVSRFLMKLIYSLSTLIHLKIKYQIIIIDWNFHVTSLNVDICQPRITVRK
jgi:hypothetical protein